MRVQFIILIFMIIFLLSFVSSLKIGISPPKVEFDGKIGEKICKNIILYSDVKVTLLGEDWWNSEDKLSSDLNDYGAKAKDLKIKLSYPQKPVVKTKKDITICINSSEGGIYYGILIYKSDEGYAGVGNYLILNISGNDNENKDNSKENYIVGSVIGSGNNQNKNNLLRNLLISTTGTFIVLIFGLLFFSKKKNSKIV